MLASIGMPIYNAEKYLAAAIQSILDQTFTDFELIISDNASTDGTQAICERYAAADPRIRYHRNATNLGLSANFNQAFKLATGKYFAWAAHDDTRDPTWLARCIAVLEERPDVAVCFTGTNIINDDGSVRHQSTDGHVQAARPVDRMRRFFDGTPIYGGGGNMIFGLHRADVLRQTALLESYLIAERILIVELALHGNFFEIPDYLFNRRMDENRMAHRYYTRKEISAREYAAFFGGKSAAKWLPLQRIQRLLGYIRAIGRVPMPFAEKLACYSLLAGQMLPARLRRSAARSPHTPTPSTPTAA